MIDVYDTPRLYTVQYSMQRVPYNARYMDPSIVITVTVRLQDFGIHYTDYCY